MNLKKLKQDVLRFAGRYLLSGCINVLCKSLRITFVNKSSVDELENDGKNFILAFWHGTMLLPWFLHRNKNFAALTSKSKDGDLLARVLTKWNYKVIRGSSHKDGSEALEILIDCAKNNKTILITPDGPTGPPYKMKAGAVVAAKKSSVPLVLVGISFEKKIRLKNWDGFEIPKFFSRAKVVYSDPVFVEGDLNYEATSRLLEHCELKLNELQKNADS